MPLKMFGRINGFRRNCWWKSLGNSAERYLEKHTRLNAWREWMDTGTLEYNLEKNIGTKVWKKKAIDTRMHFWNGTFSGSSGYA